MTPNSSYYPAYLDLHQKQCVVVGGGMVAQRKVEGLLECGARVTCVSPTITAELELLVRQGQVCWLQREYVTGDLAEAFLAIAATDHPEVHQAVAEEAKSAKVLLNVVDVPSLCTFIAPSVIRHGQVTVAISTGGSSPALARKLREGLEQSQVLQYADLAHVLSQARTEIKRRGVQVSPERWQQAIAPELVSLVHQGKAEQALQKLLGSLLAQDGTTA